MPFREQPLDPVYTPPKYPNLDYTAEAEVSRVYVPEDGTVGWIARQGDAQIEWFSAVPPEHLGYGIRRHVDSLLRVGALDRVAAAAVWDTVLRDTLHTPPTVRPLPEVLDEARAEWDVD